MTSSMVAMDAPMSSSLGAMGPLLRKLDLLTGTNRDGLPLPLKLRIGLLKEDLEDISADLLEQSMADFPSKMANYWMDETKLMDWLTNKAEHQLNVVTIVGPAGVGKTTLAKELYRDLGRHFECWAFVQVSRKPDTIKLLQSLLSQVRQHQHHSDVCMVQNLIDGLREHLQDKRYFIVIDDLWETSAWDIIYSAFPEGDNCSRIIATVENVDVALECCGYQLDHIVRMKPLGHQDSEKLLFNRVFGSELQCPDELMEVSHGIIRICGGLPLAIISTASLLSRQRDNSELWHQIHKYLCFIWNINPALEEIQKGILNLIYISLPLHLKTCLLYLSVYLEGYTIWKVDLVKQWVSEGFISAAEEKDSEEVAESYFYELVKMGMIQPMQINYNGEVLSFTVHHIVLDLITHKSKEEKFITLIDQSQTITVTKAYRLSLHFNKSQYAKKQEVRTLSHVRSLAFFGFHKCMPSILEFKLLRVLILEFRGDPHGCMSLNLSGISQLLQLRYFKIECDITVELPGQMQGLLYLETLEINARISALPSDIVQLPSLLHLCLREEKNLPDGIGCIKSLRTLQYFNLSSNSEDSIWSLGKLTNLQNLHLTCSAPPCDEHLKRNLLALAYSLGKLRNLKSLTLAPGTSGSAVLFDWSSIISFPPIFLQRLELLPPICVFFRLPEWIGHLHKLSSLKVVVRELLMKDINMLAELSALTVLSLYVRQPTAEFIVFNRAAFPVLKCFKFWCGVLCLAFQEKALSNLERLKVGFNAHREEQFGHIIAGVEHLLNLRVIDGHIGAAAGAQESDRKAAEAALKYSISNHSMSPILNIQMIDCVDEEIRIPHLIDLPASSSQTLMGEFESCISSLTILRKSIVRRCQKPGWVQQGPTIAYLMAEVGNAKDLDVQRVQKGAQSIARPMVEAEGANTLDVQRVQRGAQTIAWVMVVVAAAVMKVVHMLPVESLSYASGMEAVRGACKMTAQKAQKVVLACASAMEVEGAFSQHAVALAMAEALLIAIDLGMGKVLLEANGMALKQNEEESKQHKEKEEEKKAKLDGQNGAEDTDHGVGATLNFRGFCTSKMLMLLQDIDLHELLQPV
ncbi:hypothetical protein ZWY2020_018931 [Hordeum vulgare]|nr:hypothetical protein ZWY2020_018931 [Hordeum vulgare]